MSFGCESIFSCGDVGAAAVRSHSGRMNSRGLMMTLYISPSPVFRMMDINSEWLIFPNPLGIHNAGCSYASSLNIVMVVLFDRLTCLIRLIGIIYNQFYKYL